MICLIPCAMISLCLTYTHLLAALLHIEAQTWLSHVLPGCVFNSNRSFSRLREKFFLQADTNHPFVFLVPTDTVTDLSSHTAVFVRSSPLAINGVVASICLLDWPPSKIPAGNYNAVSYWRARTARCLEYFQIPPSIRPLPSRFHNHTASCLDRLWNYTTIPNSTAD